MSEIINDGELQPIVIDLTKSLNESELMLMGAQIKWMLGRMFKNAPINAVLKGSPTQIRSFGNTLSKEKRYMDAYTRYGLDDPRTFKNRYLLQNAVKNFERVTGLTWPLK